MSIAPRSETPEAHSWNLQPMYEDRSAWEKDFEVLSNSIQKMSEFQGTLAESAEQLLKAVTCYLDLVRHVEKIYTYAHLKSDEDTADSTHLGDLQRVMKLYSEFAALSSYFTPELLEIDDAVLEGYLADERLKDVRRMLTEIVRYKPHTLSHEEETLLALGSEVFGSAGKIFSQLNNADLDFGTILVNGEEQALSHSTYSVFLKHQDREIRKTAYEQYYQVFDGHKHTIAASLTGSVKKDVYLARVKRFNSAIEGSLFSDNVDVAVYDALIDAVSNGLAPLHTYYELRKKCLGFDSVRLYDTYVPIVEDLEAKHSYDEAAEILCESLAPLGDEYVNTMRAGLTTDRWVDRFENKGKRSGAYSSGCFDSPPYILMNYKDDDLRDVYTLTHEAGHSMHSWYSKNNLNYQDSSYSIFVAEVASTFNEQLLTAHLRKKYADDKKMTAYLINHQIDDIKATFYRQTMFAEFEKIIHEKEESGEPLTIDSYREIYGGLLSKYFGSAVELQDIDNLECLRIPHFYSAFYVYKYATGLAAAIALSEQVLSGDEGAVKRYLNFLKSGCSKHPLELLKDAGVDMTSPQPVEATVTVLGRLVDELEATLA